MSTDRPTVDRAPTTRAAARANLVDELLGDLDAVCAAPLEEALDQDQRELRRRQQRERTRAQRDASPPEPFSTRLPKDLVAWARRAVYHTPGLTLAELVAGALFDELTRLEEARGEPFPELKPGQRLRTGRPVGR